MNKVSFTLAGALVLTSSVAVAQQSTRSILPFDGEIVYGGVINAATGKITPASQSFGLGLGDPIYANTAVPAQGSFFSNIMDATIYDEGRIPSTTSPLTVGTQDSYDLSSMSLQYVTDATDPSLGGTGITIVIELFESYAACSIPDATNPPLETLTFTGLPGSTTGGLSGFVFDVDLTALAITIAADGDGVFSDGASDLFGWSFAVTDPADGTASGPFIRGDPDFQAEGDSTVFQSPAAPAGTGLSTMDFNGRLNADGTTQCLFFGGYPANVFASYALILRANLDDGTLGTSICDGVANSVGAGAALAATGDLSAAANALNLDVTALPFNSTGYFIVSQDTILIMNPGGSAGNICIASSVIGRYSSNVLDSGMDGAVSFSPDLAALPFASGMGMFGTTPAMAGDTYNFQYWYRDTDAAGAPTNNFSSAVSLTFE